MHWANFISHEVKMMSCVFSIKSQWFLCSPAVDKSLFSSNTDCYYFNLDAEVLQPLLRYPLGHQESLCWVLHDCLKFHVSRGATLKAVTLVHQPHQWSVPLGKINKLKNLYFVLLRHKSLQRILLDNLVRLNSKINGLHTSLISGETGCLSVFGAIHLHLRQPLQHRPSFQRRWCLSRGPQVYIRKVRLTWTSWTFIQLL